MAIRKFDRCPRCDCPLVKSKAISGVDSEYWYECTECNTYVNSYVPQPHQEAVHRDPHKHKGNFGGYGTGKTTTSREQIYKHMFITPKGNTLVGTKFSYQYEQTIKRDIEADLPDAFIADRSAQKQYYDLINGHRLMFRTLEDPGKLRSFNLTMYVIVEASEVSLEVFTQLKTRLRNTAATTFLKDEKGNIVYAERKGGRVPVIDHDWREGIVESNPDSGWVRSEVLNVSDVIYTHGDITERYTVLAEKADPFTSSHVAETSVNIYLPTNYIAENSKNKPIWWINRYLKGSFNYAEGLVYPHAMDCLVDDFEIPKTWKRLVAFDYGLSDAACYVCAAVDEKKGILYVYKETRDYNKSVEDLAKIYFSVTADIPAGGLYGAPIIDPKSAPKRDYTKKSLADHFLEYGICFEPGYTGVDARVFRLNTYIESGRLKIFKSCGYLIDELREYKFPDKKLGVSNHAQDKPVDKNNHAINPLEWIVMKLPADPSKILYGVYNSEGVDLTKTLDEQQAYAHYALTDNDDNIDDGGLNTWY